MLGTIQAAEAIRYLTGVGDLFNRILIFDALNMKFRTVNVKPSELDLTEFGESYDQPVCDLRSRPNANYDFNELQEQMIEHAKELPNECCGYITGAGGCAKHFIKW